MRTTQGNARPLKYIITHKPIVHVGCGALTVTHPMGKTVSKCNGVLMRQTLSRIEEGLGHEGFMCDACGRRVKYVPPKEG